MMKTVATPTFEQVYDHTLLYIADETGTPPEELQNKSLYTIGFREREFILQLLFESHRYFKVNTGQFHTYKRLPQDIDTYLQKATVETLSLLLHRRFLEVLLG